MAGFFLSRSCQVVGIDLSRQGVQLARLTYPNARFEELPADQNILERLGEEPFDIVVSAEVIEHLYTPRDFARGCFAALKPGGKFLCTTPYHGYLKNILICVLNQFDNHFNPLRDGGHIKFWSLKTLTVPPTNRSWLLQYRFSAVQEGCPFFGSRWSSRPKNI